MIISASYKTDIPAFYGEWFRNRLRAGYCRMVNPYNANQRYLVSLRREDIEGFVFWTKNLTPFEDTLDEVHCQDFPFVVQYTINGYPRALESRVMDPDQSMQTFRAAADRYGPDVLVWRYDPILLSTLTDADFHRANFARLASGLSGSTNEVVVSYMQVYRKTRLNLDESARECGFDWYDPSAEVKRALLTDLSEIADAHDIHLSVCTQPDLLVPGAREARCVDAARLARMAGRTVMSKLKRVRPGCGCYESKDIGDYDTCPHGCVYCYAVRRRHLALRRYRAHDPRGEYLFPPKARVPSPSQGLQG